MLKNSFEIQFLMKQGLDGKKQTIGILGVKYLRNSAKQFYLFFAKPFFACSSLLYASPTITRKYFFESQTNQEKESSKSSFGKNLLYITGSLAGLNFLLMQYQFYYEKMKDNPEILLIPGLSTLASFVYETAREMKNAMNEIKKEDEKIMKKTRDKEQRIKKNLESITKENE